MTVHELSRLNKEVPTEMEMAERDVVAFCSPSLTGPRLLSS